MTPQVRLENAARDGDLDAVRKAIAAGADPKANDSQALQRAAIRGHTECVRLLIPVSDPKAFKSEALYWAARNGHAECVKVLIPVSDPRADGSHALRCAAGNGHIKCVRLLIPVSDTKVAREKMTTDIWHPSLALVDAIIEEEALKAKHLKSTDERARVGL